MNLKCILKNADIERDRPYNYNKMDRPAHQELLIEIARAFRQSVLKNLALLAQTSFVGAKALTLG